MCMLYPMSTHMHVLTFLPACVCVPIQQSRWIFQERSDRRRSTNGIVSSFGETEEMPAAAVAAGLCLLSTASCTSIKMTSTGTMKESTTTIISCFGVLMMEVCSDECWSLIAISWSREKARIISALPRPVKLGTGWHVRIGHATRP